MRFGGLIAAIVVAAIAAVIVLRMQASDNTPPPVANQPVQAEPIKTTNVFVAAQAIPIGASITADMVAIQPWPEHLVLDGFVKSDAGLGGVVGMVARTPFQPQEPILSTKLANANDPNFLAGMLPKGMRVITLQTNEIEGLAGFIFPGDHVDIMLTHDVDKWVTDPAGNGNTNPPHKERDTVTETLITNIKVLAVDQRATGGTTVDQNGKLVVPRSVSVMVSPADAQRLRLGQQKGTLTMELRALADRDSIDPLTLTSVKDISQYPDATDTAAPGANGGSYSVTIVRGVSSVQNPVITNQPAAGMAIGGMIPAPAPAVQAAPKL